MDIKKLLEYQEIDKDLYKLESELKNDESAKKVAHYSAIRAAATDELQKLDRYTDDMMKSFERLDAMYSKLERELEDISSAMNAVENAKEVDYYTRAIENLKVSIEGLDSDSKRLQKKLDDTYKQAKEEQNRGIQSQSKLAAAKEEFVARKTALQPVASTIMKKLKEALVGITAEDLATYNEIRKKKMPVIVSYRDKTCGGCGMEISSSTCEKIESGAVVECSTCGRLVYKA